MKFGPYTFSGDAFPVIAGPCVIESERHVLKMARLLAEALKNDLPGIKGLSGSQLWFMRQFYLNYRGNEDLLQLVREIPWGQNIAIFTKVKDPREDQAKTHLTESV